MNRRLLLDIVVPQSAAVLEPLGREDQHLLVRRNVRLFLDLGMGQARGSGPARCVCVCVCGWVGGWVGQVLEALVHVQVQVHMVMSVNWPCF